MTFVAELEPRAVWRHFDQILSIPRPSKGEEAMRRHVRELAARREGTATRQDDAGNLVVTVPATPGCEGAEPVVIQSHLDMVQEKNSSSDFDFASDAIRPLRDGDYLTADGTTLGADNGLGVAAMLAILEGADDELRHGPLELLFTIDEETGLTGAAELAPDLLEGRRLLNLDTEEEGALYVGCAGGGDSLLRLPVKSVRAGESQDGEALRVALTGLKGGHSGVDIHLQRGNAIRLLARVLRAAAEDGAVPLVLAAIRGGTAHNAIPREAFAGLRVPAGMADEAAAALERAFADVRDEYRTVDPDMELTVEARESGEAGDGDDAENEPLSADSGDQLLALLAALPHGVVAMSHDIPDLVETSSNLARVRRRGDHVEVLMSTRSSVATALEAQRDHVRAIAELAGAEVEEEEAYPGWQPDMDSDLLATLRRLHREVLGEDPEIKAIHAGLETGIIGEKYPGMEMISFGPRIEYPHSPDERALIPTVAPFWKLLKAALAELGCGD